MAVNEDETLLPTPEAAADARALKIQDLANRLAAAPETAAKADEALQKALDENASLKVALQTRTVIGEAVGLLMGRHNMTADDAFALLVRQSSHTNRKIRVLATEMVEEANAGAGVTSGVLRSLRLD